jgi:non-ribosomal peptide synthetase component F
VQLNARANRLAHQLVERGVCHDVVLGIMLERSFELIIAILATLKVRTERETS